MQSRAKLRALNFESTAVIALVDREERNKIKKKLDNENETRRDESTIR